MRRAGAGQDADGRLVWWSVAEGQRGRRWREAIVGGGGLVHSLLLETGPDRRFTHLELATPAGLLTLHPEPDGTLHGNAVTDRGMRHVAGLAWDPDGLVILAGSTIAAAAAGHLLATLLPPGATPAGMSTSQLVLRIAADLSVATAFADVELGTDGRYVVADSGVVATDGDGLPLLDEARSWPLEAA
ncbi:MAG TPA: hypothetical protein VFK54_03510 [Candidatus Limnocylindrales bacterium]|nr:hypothetical protein [Candidatus Limnocylindrales bacterium]